jgi:rhodanese-related sulfurtransferase
MSARQIAGYGYVRSMNDHAHDTIMTIPVGELVTHVANNDAFVLDLRHGTHAKQIYGAIQYDTKKLLEAPKLAVPLPKSEGLIVLYDEDGTSKSLHDVGAKLRADGFAEVRILEGGFAAYVNAGGKLEDRTMEQPVPLVSEHQVER